MIEIGSAIDPGRRRIASKNQDSLGILRPSLLGLNWRPPLVVIADGMGGYAGGAVASQIVIESFTRTYLHSRPGAPPAQVLEDGVTNALASLKRAAARDSDLARMGSTVVAAVLEKISFTLLNVGDSRAYLVNQKEIRQISYDHSLVADQLRQGLISEAEARAHPRRNVLSMSISAQRDQVETFAGEFNWQPGDTLVLCSDGLWGPVTEPQIQAVVLEFVPQQAAEKLVALANTNQGPDNISVIVARNR